MDEGAAPADNRRLGLLLIGYGLSLGGRNMVAYVPGDLHIHVR